MLPLQRPELFAKGALTKGCKGVLLFGPPGTGKTLLAKAVATEAGANFINITASNITSKWFGDAEKLTRAAFSTARKLAPSVIFVDEVDSLLGARGGAYENEAARKMKTEFMSCWDGLKSSDAERVLVLAATNRPFDLDEAVIRRMPRRILVGLPDAANREKILQIILRDEDLAAGFDFGAVANMTDGYSGSDLKNLCVAAAYRPIRELLDEEAKMRMEDGCAAKKLTKVRQLGLEDFQKALEQVSASVSKDTQMTRDLEAWNEQYGEGGSRAKRTFGFTA